jgi:hypothetical protein
METNGITTILSLGAGVQSSAVALMSAARELPPIDYAIFADTQYERRATYEYLDRLEPLLPFPLLRVSEGDLRKAQIDARMRGTGEHWAALPYFLDTEGAGGMIRRQCTYEYKIRPIERQVRDLIGLKPRQRAPKTHVVDQWFGISLDEVQRCKVEFEKPWCRNVYPLIEQRMTRGHCIEWLRRNGHEIPPRSACICCPFHSDKEWLEIKNGPEDEWQDVVEFDRAIRHAEGMRSNSYLHAARKPLENIDFTTPESAGQLSFLDECDGYCGV